MEISPVGLAVTAVVMVLGWRLGATVLVSVFAAIPLQSTAFVTLPALGGASPPIATLFCVLLIIATVTSLGAAGELRRIFHEQWTSWLIVGLTVYAAVGAYILPRLFVGRTSAFVPVSGVVFELPLGPVSGNVTQSCYFVLGALLFLSLLIALGRIGNWRKVQTGVFAFVTLHAVAGYVNLLGNLAGAGDLLAPIRTANYALLTDIQESGLFRVAGACSEASAFAAMAVPCCAFCIAYWRRCGSMLAFALGMAHLLLLLVSTSSTAYVTLAVMATMLLASIAGNLIGGRVPWRDLGLLAIGALGCVAGLALLLLVPAVVSALGDLLDVMVFKKHLSASGQERAYWNSQSLQTIFDTNGLGIGLGSSRTSSWLVAVLSQTGVAGALGFGAVLIAVWRAPAAISPGLVLPGNVRVLEFALATRAAVMAGLLAASVSGGAADPGLFVFAGFAIVLAAASMSERVAGLPSVPAASSPLEPDHLGGSGVPQPG